LTNKHLTLKRPDTCSVCQAALAAGMPAWWDQTTRSVTCDSCYVQSVDEAPREDPVTVAEPDFPSSDFPIIDKGTAGKSSLDECKRRHDKREARIDAKFGRFAVVVKFLTDDPQCITAWAKGSMGERVLATSLEKNLGEHAIVLSDRRVPKTRGDIDHSVVAPTGVWVVDAKNYSGLVEQRDVGGWFKTDLQLYVGGRDRSKVLDGLTWQVAAVHSALEGHDVPVLRAVCFTDAEWRLFAEPFMLRGVHVSGPNALTRRIAENPKLSSDEVLEIASRLSQSLPPKT